MLYSTVLVYPATALAPGPKQLPKAWHYRTSPRQLGAVEVVPQERCCAQAPSLLICSRFRAANTLHLLEQAAASGHAFAGFHKTFQGDLQGMKNARLMEQRHQVHEPHKNRTLSRHHFSTSFSNITNERLSIAVPSIVICNYDPPA